jgi:DNA ligase-associated metallophosphoesterase
MLRDSSMIECAGEQIELLAQRALHWVVARTLFIADAHLGKGAAFRASGIAVPERTTGADLERLTALLSQTGAERLVILGDLLHAQASRTQALFSSFAAWRAAHQSLTIVLVRGNHDRRAGDPPESWNIRCVDPGERLGPFALLHEPDGCVLNDEHEHGYALAGHIHPTVVAHDPGGLAKRDARHRLPAFIMGQTRALLPSFGSFTGGGRITPASRDRVFAIVDERPARLAELPVRVPSLASST